jgi:deazaflavin-dependent oxidoreductase (nitroreductase family)
MSTILPKIFWLLNTFFMTPVFRLGLGGLLGTPFGGYMMVIKVAGRKSGKIRYAPVNYAIRNGAVYCISGFRKRAEWFRNLQAHPEVELLLPGGAIFARGEQVDDPDERRIVARQVLKNAGFAGFFEGYNPRTISDADLQAKIADIPVLRFQPLGLGSGAFDAGGWAWVWPVLATAGLLWWWLG